MRIGSLRTHAQAIDTERLQGAQRFRPFHADDAGGTRLDTKAEPRLALAGGADGMDLVRKIVEQAPKYMKPQSYLLLEIGHEALFFEAAFPWLSFCYLPVTAGENMLVLVSRRELAEHAKSAPAARQAS